MVTRPRSTLFGGMGSGDAQAHHARQTCELCQLLTTAWVAVDVERPWNHTRSQSPRMGGRGRWFVWLSGSRPDLEGLHGTTPRLTFRALVAPEQVADATTIGP